MKRAFDLTGAMIGLILTSPILLVAAIAVKLGSPGPAFYSGPRVGRGGTVFEIHKLRSMKIGAADSGPSVTAAGDPRVTPAGRFLRRTKIDELPQLWNVVKGEMSLVGPRPEHPDFVARFTERERRLLSVRPGMTGPAALEFHDEERRLRVADPVDTYVHEVLPRKLEIELGYLDSAGFVSDLVILARTLWLVLRRLFVRADS
ncbi:MAG TPA: sugar transferase [Patescibacteria group bacterium]|nr:sugar transferase [Patescibacteria group bacterium]